LCCLGIWTTGRVGLSRLISTYPDPNNMLASINEAARLSPSDPEVHSQRGYIFLDNNKPQEALKEFERALSLRPRDYVFWMDLGYVHDWLKNSDKAIAAYNEAVRLAPYYSRPRWLLGNLLLRSGEYDKAFAELRLAYESDPTLLNAIADLAWSVYRADAETVKQVIQPKTAQAQLTLVHFFIKKGSIDSAINIFRELNSIPDKDRDLLLTDLINKKNFEAAYEVWLTGQKEKNIQHGKVIDGGFEDVLSRNNTGFGWQIKDDLSTVKVNLETDKPYDNTRCLRVDWKGNNSPSVPVLSQILLVAPKSDYQLTFATRTEKLVTGGLPIVVITDASDGSVLVQSNPIKPDNLEWSEQKINFTTKENTRAVVINVQRLNCTTSPCPVFGRVWFDAFQLIKLKS
jgi:tetratricopeptide (TPR) repeat protein